MAVNGGCCEILYSGCRTLGWNEMVLLIPWFTRAFAFGAGGRLGKKNRNSSNEEGCHSVLVYMDTSL